jgi:hypothetical protein
MAVLKKVKGSEYSYKGNDVIDCYFMEDYSGYSVCLVNEHNKTVTPVHGYYPPHPTAKYIKKLAEKLGYEFISY